MSERATDGTPDPSPVKEVSPTIGNVQPIVAIPTPPLNEQKSTEPSMFTIAKLLDSARPITERLSISEANSLMEMRSKIDERLRRSESSEMRPASGNPAFSFMNQLYIWSTLKMMESGGATPAESNPPGTNDSEMGAVAQARDLHPHPLAMPSGSSSNDSELSKMSRESSNASPAGSDVSGDHNDLNGSGLLGVRKKKTRTVFSRSQVSQLESAFNSHRYLNSNQRSQLAVALNLTETQVKIWFQNRRNKWKRQYNGEDINSSLMRPNSNAELGGAAVTFGARANADDAMRLLLQQQPNAINHASLFAQPALGLPNLPPFFGLSHPLSDSAGSKGERSPATTSGFDQFARLFAPMLLNANGNAALLENPKGSGSTNNSDSDNDGTPGSSHNAGEWAES